MQLVFVIPGWYKQESFGDSIQTIKVLCEGSKPNVFKLLDGREMSEYEILNNWEYMPTSPTESGIEEKFDLGNLEETNNENVSSDNFDEKTIQYEESQIKKAPYIIQPPPPLNYNESADIPTQKIKNKFHQLSEDEIFVNQLLKQISSENDLEKFGQVKFKTTFDIPIKFNFDYDLTKLKNLIKIMNIDKMKLDLIIEKIISNNSENVLQLLRESIKNHLLTEDEIINKPINIEDNKINKYLKDF